MSSAAMAARYQASCSAVSGLGCLASRWAWTRRRSEICVMFARPASAFSAKVEYTPGSGPLGYRRESGYQSGTGQREAGKATEYPVDAKDHSDLCPTLEPDARPSKSKLTEM
ncbi:hypothetical protein EMIT0P228_130134 [Pseudomonas brassicacearum]